MLSFRKGTSGAPGAAKAMADYLGEANTPVEWVAMASYYAQSAEPTQGTAAVPRYDMDIAVAVALGIDQTRSATQAEVAMLLQGLRADGDGIVGKAPYRAQAKNDRVTYYDFTFSAPKSVSIAMALAETDAERAIIVGCHQDAWQAAMLHLEDIVAHARKGHAGSKGSVAGNLGWVSYQHHTARPTMEIPHTEDDGTRSTIIHTIKSRNIAADMQLHTHVATPNAVFCRDGSVGSIDSLALHERVHEVGAYYQAHLATNLRAQGIDTVLDEKTKCARLTAVPEHVVAMFSKRGREGERAAQERIAKLGLDWDALNSYELMVAIKHGVRDTRQAKDGISDPAEWCRQAAEAGYTHSSVIDPAARSHPLAPDHERLAHAYQAALPVLEEQFDKRATMLASIARVAAARGLIASGVRDARDINAVTKAMREHGVRHDGQQVPLVWTEAATVPEDGEVTGRVGRLKITTMLHVAWEREALALATRGAEDRSQALTPGQIDRAIRDVSARDGLDFSSEHGERQKAIIHSLGAGGKVAIALGVAGAGKSTLLRPLVEAWTAPTEHLGDERVVYGTALATRQSDALADGGIDPRNTMPIAALLRRAAAGELALDERSVVVVDEVGQVGTKHALNLLKLRDQIGFSVVAIGDDKQAQAVDAGNTINLMRRALGAEAVPELNTSVRQLRERDRETALLFRSGDAAAGLGRLREDGRAVLVQGGHRHAVEATANLWAGRHAANAGRKGYKLTVSAPTNDDARAISAEIRLRRRAAGQVGPDAKNVNAADQNGVEYELPLAVGDRVRLFDRTPASFDGKGGNLGNNGSVVEVRRIDADGLQLRNHKGSSGFVRWDTLRDPASGRIRLTYGDVLSIDAIQGATSTEHIDAMPSGSAAVNSFKSYVAKSRSREATYVVVSDGAERREVGGRRALGADPEITEEQVWGNVARNLARRPEKELATDLLDRATSVQVGTVRSLATAFQPVEQRQVDKTPAPSRRDEAAVREAAPAMAVEAARGEAAIRRLTGPAAARQEVRAGRQAMRPASQRPKVKEMQPVLTQTEVEIEFATALDRAGLRLRGKPIMDGQWHRTEVEGARKGRLSGSYRASVDGRPGGFIVNRKSGFKVGWQASGGTREMSVEDRRAEQVRLAADRAARAQAKAAAEVAAATQSRETWGASRPATSGHPYLLKKGIRPHGARVDGQGNLLVPMRDIDGTVWNVQRIMADRKLFAKGGRTTGTFAMMGKPREGEPLLIAEGFATAATLREATGFAVVVAFDSGNLAPVAKALREQESGRVLILAADNDHHLPRRPKPLPNAGMEKAEEAAKAVGGIVVGPTFRPDQPETDWNDYAKVYGMEATREALRAALAEHGIALPDITQAQRDAARQQVRSAPQSANEDAARAAQEAARRAQQARPSNGPHLSA